MQGQKGLLQGPEGPRLVLRVWTRPLPDMR